MEKKDEEKLRGLLMVHAPYLPYWDFKFHQLEDMYRYLYRTNEKFRQSPGVLYFQKS